MSRKEQIERIQKMEAKAHLVEDTLEVLEKALADSKAVLKDYKELVDYYTSGDWFDDTDYSNTPDFPEDVACGVTSQDWLFDIIGNQRYNALAAIELGLEILKM